VRTCPSVHRTAPHRTAPHRTAPHRTAPHRTAPHRTGKIEQRVRSRRQALMKLGPEPRQHPQCTGRAGIMHTDLT